MYHERMAEFERQLLLETLESVSGCLRQAAKLLGILEPTLRYRLAKLGLREHTPSAKVRSKLRTSA